MKSYKKYLLVSIFLSMSLAFIISLNINTVAASSPTGIYVSNSGNDKWDGLSPTRKGMHGPKKTIKKAVGTIGKGGTIYIASGIYHEQGITITKNMKIKGANKRTTIINSMYKGNMLTVASGVNLTISNLGLYRGKADSGGAIINAGRITLFDTIFTNNQAVNRGGAIYNKKGFLNIIHSSFTNNSVKNGYAGAIYNHASTTIDTCIFSNNTAKIGGGSIFNFGILNVNNSNFTNNRVYAGGGTIRNAQGTSTINRCNFTGNKVNGGGGAVFNIADKTLKNPSTTTTIIKNSNFIANTASNGGALDNFYGKLTVTNCSFTSNSASRKGGAMINYYGQLNIVNTNASYNRAFAFAGVLFTCGPASISQSTFKSNIVTNGSGGVFYNFNSTLNISSSNFTANSACGTGPNDQGYGGSGHNFLGTISILKSSFTTNTATTGGGAITNDAGSILMIKSSTFIRNSAKGNVNSPYGNGGAIFSYGSYGIYNTTLVVYNTTFIGNTAKNAGRGGGAIEALSGTDINHSVSSVTNCQFYNNTASYGGAIQTQFGTFTVTNCIFNNNVALVNGGAIFTLHDLTIVNNTTLINNQASGHGSAIYNSGFNIQVNYNNIITNSGIDQIYCPNNLYTPENAKYFVYAQNNWWGSDDDPSEYVSTSGNSVIVDNWLHSEQML